MILSYFNGRCFCQIIFLVSFCTTGRHIQQTKLDISFNRYLCFYCELSAHLLTSFDAILIIVRTLATIKDTEVMSLLFSFFLFFLATNMLGSLFVCFL